MSPKFEDYEDWVKRLEGLSHEDVRNIFLTCCGVALSDDQYRVEYNEHSASLVVRGSALGFPFSDAEKVEKEARLDAADDALGGDGWTYDQNDDVVFEGPEDQSWCDYDTRNPFPI